MADRVPLTFGTGQPAAVPVQRAAAAAALVLDGTDAASGVAGLNGIAGGDGIGGSVGTNGSDTKLSAAQKAVLSDGLHYDGMVISADVVDPGGTGRLLLDDGKGGTFETPFLNCSAGRILPHDFVVWAPLHGHPLVADYVTGTLTVPVLGVAEVRPSRVLADSGQSLVVDVDGRYGHGAGTCFVLFEVENFGVGTRMYCQTIRAEGDADIVEVTFPSTPPELGLSDFFELNGWLWATVRLLYGYDTASVANATGIYRTKDPTGPWELVWRTDAEALAPVVAGGYLWTLVQSPWTERPSDGGHESHPILYRINPTTGESGVFALVNYTIDDVGTGLNHYDGVTNANAPRQIAGGSWLWIQFAGWVLVWDPTFGQVAYAGEHSEIQGWTYSGVLDDGRLVLTSDVYGVFQVLSPLEVRSSSWPQTAQPLTILGERVRLTVFGLNRTDTSHRLLLPAQVLDTPAVAFIDAAGQLGLAWLATAPDGADVRGACMQVSEVGAGGGVVVYNDGAFYLDRSVLLR